MNQNFEPDNSEIKRKYTPKEVGHDDFRKPVKRTNIKRVKKNKPNVGLIIIAVLFAIVFAVGIYFIVNNKNNNGNKPASTDTLFFETTDEVTTEDPGYITVSVSEDDMYKGDLILVNSQHLYHFLNQNLVEIKQYMNDYYLLSSYSTQLELSVVNAFNSLASDYYAYNDFKYMQVNSAFRSYEDQVNLVNEYTEAYGEDYVKQYVAVPGYSEHHTGLALDLNVNVNGAIYYVESYEPCEWFRTNAENYGFILRYPSDKVYLTGISAESWHYRYVGVPHAKVMNYANICLEEYIDYLKDYTFDTQILGINSDGSTYTFTFDEEFEGYGVFYTPYKEETTNIKIPSKCEYTISGNNFDGFIITIHR